ncbi:MAG: hypothetical protein AB1921_14870 [Thermodesulfobacteriota bacterium]
MGAPHRYSFVRLAGFDQVVLETGEDIAGLQDLDLKLWAALACPAKGLDFDARTLELLDTDGDGRIRHPEVIAAVNWTLSLLKDPASLLQGRDELPLSAVREDTPEGKALASSCRRVLAGLGKEKAEAISVSDTSAMAAAFFAMPLNGDGIVTEKSADTPALASAIGDIVSVIEPDLDRSGLPGLTHEKCDQFFADATDYLFWRKKAESDPGRLLPFGKNTEEAYAAFIEVRDKAEDFFTRCRLAGFDPKAVEALNGGAERYAALAAADLSKMPAELSSLPLAPVSAGAALPLSEAVNPAWAGRMKAFTAKVATPFLGSAKNITENQWRAICTAFAPYEAWLAEKPGAHLEKLTPSRVDALVSGGFAMQIRDLIEADRALAPEAEALLAVEKLARFHRYLFEFLQNFVNFKAFYTRKQKAAFQAGTLFLDGRACRLCVSVADAAKHAALADRSGIYLVYCDCTRKGGTEKRSVAAAFTDGDAERLMVGRNGVFFDRNGNDWDATVVKIVDHPMSIRQAVWAPYKRIARLISDQIKKMAQAREKAVEQKSTAAVEKAGAEAPGKTPKDSFDAGRFAGIFAAIGLALGAIGTAVASMVSGFLNLSWYQMPLMILGIMLLISGPSVVLAWLALRRRNLGPLLDANGWAVNTRARISTAFARSLTSLATIPRGSRKAGSDPYGAAPTPWWMIALLLLAIAAAAASYYLTR